MSLSSLSRERKELQANGYLPDWFITQGWQLFKEKYVDDVDRGFLGQAERIAKTASSYMPDPDYWYPKFFNLIWKGWLSLSTPVLSNMGTNKGMSVSCSGNYIGDSIDQFYRGYHEIAMLTKYGFGTSSYLGDIRPRGAPISSGGYASGVKDVFMDSVTVSRHVSQGNNRRGAWAGYLPMSHGDFHEIADYVKNHPDDANIGWNIYDSDTLNLINDDPETTARWKKILKLRALTGKGYLFFPDKVNRARPKMYKDLGLEVKSSNLCTEITLFQDEEHTYTCVLSSMNLAKYDEWKDTDAIFTATVFLDCVAEDFIQKAEDIPALEKAVRFTKKGRALGLGVCGYHTYLQQNMIPFESPEAHLVNNQIFSKLQHESLQASQWMAKELGEPEWCKGYGVRNTHRTAIAPTMSTALIMGGVSQGIEPVLGNAFIQASAAGEVERINPVFLKLLKEKGIYSKDLVQHVASKMGSVQDLSDLSAHEKLVLKTAFEIDQSVIIRKASQRQPKLCQSQSLNLFFSSEENEEYIARQHTRIVLDPNITSAYYLRSQSGVSASRETCIACT